MESIKGKTIAITGATGALGREICWALAERGANFIFVDRNLTKSEEFAKQIMGKYPQIKIKNIKCDLLNVCDVKNTQKLLAKLNFDIFFLNSGIFNVPVKKNEIGTNNIFQVNFLSQYYLARKLLEDGHKMEKIVAMGSIAYRSAKFNEKDFDYSKGKAQQVYGMSKKFLIYSFFAMQEKFPSVEFGIAHPGITATQLTTKNNAFVKGLMKILFPSVKKASRSAVCAICNPCERFAWYGPPVFDVYGKPKLKKLRVDNVEVETVLNCIEKLYQEMLKSKT